MSGALIALSAVGAQDAQLTASPSFSFYQSVYRRYAPFQTEMRDQVFSGPVGWGQRSVCKVARCGDLLGKTFLQMDLSVAPTTVPGGIGWYAAEAAISHIELWIGGQLIDRHYSPYFRLYDECIRNEDFRQAYSSLTDCRNASAGQSVQLYLPLLFSFCSLDPAMAIPLVSLQYADVELVVYWSDTPPLGLSDKIEATLVSEYVFLGPQERATMAQNPNTMLITQVQALRTPVDIRSAEHANNILLSFNHPVSSLLFAFGAPGVANHGIFTGGTTPLQSNEALAPLKSARLMLNGTEYGKARNGQFTRLINSWARKNQVPSAGVYSMHFCLDPSASQPSGSINMSRVDNVSLDIVTKAASASTAAAVVNPLTTTITACQDLTYLIVYAINFNWLRFESGMCGMAFSS